MIFEHEKYYCHKSGLRVKILGRIESTLGAAYVIETHEPGDEIGLGFLPSGDAERDTAWTEIGQAEFDGILDEGDAA